MSNQYNMHTKNTIGMFQGVIAGTFLRDGQAALYNTKVE